MSTDDQTPNPVEQTAAKPGARPVRERDWYSGFCGPGPCRDGYVRNEDGTPHHYCLGVCENGFKAARRYLHCACECHTTNPHARQIDPAR